MLAFGSDPSLTGLTPSGTSTTGRALADRTGHMKSFSGMNKLGLEHTMADGRIDGLGRCGQRRARTCAATGCSRRLTGVQSSTNAPVLRRTGRRYPSQPSCNRPGLFSNQVVSASGSRRLDSVTHAAGGEHRPALRQLLWRVDAKQSDASYPTGVYSVLRINTAHDGNKVLSLNLTNVSGHGVSNERAACRRLQPSADDLTRSRTSS